MKPVTLLILAFSLVVATGCGESGSVSPQEDAKVKQLMSHGLSAPGGPKGGGAPGKAAGPKGQAGGSATSEGTPPPTEPAPGK